MTTADCVSSVDVAPVTDSAVGVIEAPRTVARVTDTETDVEVVWPRASVTVQVAVPLSVWPVVRPVPVNVVSAPVGELIVMPVPPAVNAQEYVYGATPPEALTETALVEMEAVMPPPTADEGETLAVGSDARPTETDTVAEAVWP